MDKNEYSTNSEELINTENYEIDPFLFFTIMMGVISTHLEESEEPQE